MEKKTNPKGVFRKNTRTIADAQRSIREDNEIDEATKEEIVRFMSYLAIDNLKTKTVISYTVSLRKLARLCPEKGFLYLQRPDIQEMILALQEEGYRTSTMNLFKARFLRFQRWLREEYGYPADYPDSRIADNKLDLACLKACRFSFFLTPARLPSSCRMARTAFAFSAKSSPVLSKCLLAFLRMPVETQSGAFLTRPPGHWHSHRGHAIAPYLLGEMGEEELDRLRPWESEARG